MRNHRKHHPQDLFYEAHDFKLNGKRQLEEGTPEYIVMLERD